MHPGCRSLKDDLLCVPWHAVILDEAHNLKNASTAVGLRILRASCCDLCVPWHTVIFDEAHNLKNASTAVGLRLRARQHAATWHGRAGDLRVCRRLHGG